MICHDEHDTSVDESVISASYDKKPKHKYYFRTEEEPP